MVYIIEIIYFKIFVDLIYFVSNIYIIEIFQYTFFVEMIFVVIYILEKFLNERKKDNQSFAVFVILRIKQSIGKMKKIFKFRSF